MITLIVTILLCQPVASYKFLAYNPQFANSHVNFIARITDVLINAGHEVVMLSPKHDSVVGGPGTTKPRIIEIRQSEVAKNFERLLQGQGSMDIWSSERAFAQHKGFDEMRKYWAEMCEDTLLYPGLLESLRNEKFDVAYAESLDLCSAGLFHLIGVKKFVYTESMAILDSQFHVTQTPSLPSYVPSTMDGRYGEAMNLWQRTYNFLQAYVWQFVTNRDLYRYQNLFQKHFPGTPDIVELTNQASLVFFNSEPLLDFPRPTSSRMIDIGGISVAAGHKPTWSDILDLRKQTVLLSFGTFAKSYLMPESYKENIRQTAKKFPDVTFIWKYEKSEHKVAKGIANIIDATWVPQHDLLHDPRLTAFITHCGQGSTTEAYSAGIPLIVVPVIADQFRNAQAVKRSGVGLVLDKMDLSQPEPLEHALREILKKKKYRERAREVKSTIEDRPFPMTEIFVRNMEFVAKHGPLRQLDHYGRHLNFFQYYLIDVIALLSLITLSLLSIVSYIIYKFGKLISTIIVLKKKSD